MSFHVHNNYLFTIASRACEWCKIIKKVEKGRGKEKPENFLFLFDFTINSKYVILFQFESNQQSLKKKGGNPQIFHKMYRY